VHLRHVTYSDLTCVGLLYISCSRSYCCRYELPVLWMTFCFRALASLDDANRVYGRRNSLGGSTGTKSNIYDCLVRKRVIGSERCAATGLRLNTYGRRAFFHLLAPMSGTLCIGFYPVSTDRCGMFQTYLFARYHSVHCGFLTIIALLKSTRLTYVESAHM